MNVTVLMYKFQNDLMAAQTAVYLNVLSRHNRVLCCSVVRFSSPKDRVFYIKISLLRPYSMLYSCVEGTS